MKRLVLFLSILLFSCSPDLSTTSDKLTVIIEEYIVRMETAFDISRDHPEQLESIIYKLRSTTSKKVTPLFNDINAGYKAVKKEIEAGKLYMDLENQRIAILLAIVVNNKILSLAQLIIDPELKEYVLKELK